MASLYNLTGNLRRLYDLLSDGETDDAASQVMSEIKLSEVDYADKCNAYAMLIKSLNADIDAIKAEEERLEGRRKSIENNVERLKVALQNSMIALDLKKIKTLLFTFTMQKNPPSVMVDEKRIPAEYWIQPPARVDKQGLISDLKLGKVIDGAELYQTEGLRIR